MEDDELQAIRAKRMAQMRGASGGGEPGGGGMAAFPGGMPGAAGGVGGGKDDDEKRAQMEEMRRAMLLQMTQVLDNEARERLARISIVKPEKARGVEDC
ncbi:hypothetical protein BC829DRAFT_440329 [Chytridium lagenaria]|nr:hypothetical protein BC829DRAFT_440329 [Chytridium lagenaria]